MSKYTPTAEGLKAYIEALENRAGPLLDEFKVLEYVYNTLRSNANGAYGIASNTHAYQMQVERALKMMSSQGEKLTDHCNALTTARWALAALKNTEPVLS